MAQHIEGCYGIRVITRDVTDPLIGDLDGEEIHIDYAVTAEERLFLLAHLFGHTVQWNARPETVELGRSRQPPVLETVIPALMDYEIEASSYALSMFHHIGIVGMDQWLSDFSACDMAYLRHYYLTGEKNGYRTFWRESTPCIQPRPIPPFRPTKHAWRADGIVI
ncbi:MAG: hypothetical protein ABI811_11300 [Acidobacteriota bacterium]